MYRAPEEYRAQGQNRQLMFMWHLRGRKGVKFWDLKGVEGNSQGGESKCLVNRCLLCCKWIRRGFQAPPDLVFVDISSDTAPPGSRPFEILFGFESGDRLYHSHCTDKETSSGKLRDLSKKMLGNTQKMVINCKVLYKRPSVSFGKIILFKTLFLHLCKSPTLLLLGRIWMNNLPSLTGMPSPPRGVDYLVCFGDRVPACSPR